LKNINIFGNNVVFDSISDLFRESISIFTENIFENRVKNYMNQLVNMRIINIKRIRTWNLKRSWLLLVF